MILPPDHQVQRKIHMVTLGKLSPLTVEEICQLFHYKTRKSYYDIRRFVLENKIEKLFPQRTGPKAPPKRTPALEKRVIQLRLTTDKDRYAITQTLNAEGFSIKPRLVAQILADYGISKKTASQDVQERSLRLLTPEAVELLDSFLKPQKVEISRHSIQSDLQELIYRFSNPETLVQ